MNHAAVAILCAAGLAGVASAQQRESAPDQPDVRFKVEINYVEVDALVTDAQGNFVRDLRREDFEILEDGKPQDISAFSLVDIPIQRAEAPLFAPTVVPDVRSNEREFNGRIYLVLLDDLHTAVFRTPRVRAAARQFIQEYLGANDLAAIATSSGRTDANQEFTSDKALLLRALDKFMGRKLRSATLEKLEEYNRQRSLRGRAARVTDPLDFERGQHARALLETLERTAGWMGGIRGRRKAIVLIGEGIDYDVHDVFAARDASQILQDTREAVAAATRANVSFYAIDPRGLSMGAEEGIEMGSPAEDPMLRLSPTGVQDEVRQAQDSLRTLAEETGGVAIVNSNDFRDGFSRIVQANSTYYLIGFYSDNARRDGRFRKLTVRVKRTGLEVRARRGYVAPRGRAAAALRESGVSPELAAALASPVPASGILMRVFAAPFKGTEPNASVLVGVELDGSRLAFREDKGAFHDRLEVWIAAVDARGEIKDGKPNAIDLNLQPEVHREATKHGFRVTQRLALKPGRYQLRIGSRDGNGTSVGTVFYDLDIPDFYKAPLSMSGVVLTSRAAALAPTINPDAEMKQALNGPPTALREFRQQDVLRLFAEVYDTEAGTPHKVDISATVKADGGRALITQSEERSSEELQGRSGGFGYQTEIPLKDLAPGEYVLTVEARSRLSGNATVQRHVPFRISGSSS